MDDEEMLTYEEAINEIKWLACRTGSPTARKAIEMAVDALIYKKYMKELTKHLLIIKNQWCEGKYRPIKNTTKDEIYEAAYMSQKLLRGQNNGEQ